MGTSSLGLASSLGLMQEVELLRVPLVFGRAHADSTLYGADRWRRRARVTVATGRRQARWRCGWGGTSLSSRR